MQYIDSWKPILLTNIFFLFKLKWSVAPLLTKTHNFTGDVDGQGGDSEKKVGMHTLKSDNTLHF